jgi:hypothetical protein
MGFGSWFSTKISIPSRNNLNGWRKVQEDQISSKNWQLSCYVSIKVKGKVVPVL